MSEKGALLGDAAALLFPIDWPEPFGLVQIEAMACGTPVIAFRRGAVPEIIEPGVTGFIVDSVDRSGRGNSSSARARSPGDPPAFRRALSNRAHGARLC